MNDKKKSLGKALKAAEPVPPVRTDDDFWTEFKARAAHVPQDGWRLVPAPHFVVQTWLRAAAAVVILAVSGFLSITLMDRSENTGKVSNVQAVDVFMEYSSIVILEDSDHGGTFVWITEDESADGG